MWLWVNVPTKAVVFYGDQGHAPPWGVSSKGFWGVQKGNRVLTHGHVTLCNTYLSILY